MTQGLEVEGVSKSFGTEKVLRNINLTLGRGETGVIVGPSGAGKTMLLNIIAGLIKSDEGKVSIDGNVVELGGSIHVKPAERHVGYVFQDYLLFPHMTVFENVAYGLKARHTPNKLIKEKVENVLNISNLNDISEKKPAQISGGQMQRVALARAIVLEPKLLLLDEPLSALDRQTRETLRLELRKIFDSLSITVVHVTHDLDEAFLLGQKIGIIRSGELPFFGTKSDLFTHMTHSTAEFLGFNLMNAKLIRLEKSYYVFLVAGWRAEVKMYLLNKPNLTVGQDVTIAIPPESIKISISQDEIHAGMYARIKEVWEFKNRVQIVLEESDNRLVSEISNLEFRQYPLNRGDTVQITIDSALLLSEIPQ